MTKRFENAYNWLVEAYFKETLAAGDCEACAIGNIVAGAMGAKIEKDVYGDFMSDKDIKFWNWPIAAFRLSEIDKISIEDVSNLYGEAYIGIDEDIKRLESLSGYTLFQLSEIEYAFESNTRLKVYDYYLFTDKEILEDQFKGLSAVIDVMLSFEENEHNSQSLKDKFRQHPKLLTV